MVLGNTANTMLLVPAIGGYFRAEAALLGTAAAITVGAV